ncbi:copper resistance protein NlpE N-terminal domain-containing protein [Campylobacter sp.]|uniref:copper resistance protein NlpE N-terminal domain-containing protein n=1 Tax=Campylobacter sp. TaxID=205 RepID=UPI0027043F09|nr:copper resistance protein NlpE N-terminal domain-containing protein [Campylobacter sp.]
MKKLIFFLTVISLFTGCALQNLNKNECEEAGKEPACSALKEVSGEFEANILCTDCKSAISKLNLNKDKTFTLETIVHKKSAQRVFEKGTYSVKGTELTLVNQYNEKSVYKFDGINLTKLESKDSFIKESFAKNLVYRPAK